MMYSTILTRILIHLKGSILSLLDHEVKTQVLAFTRCNDP